MKKQLLTILCAAGLIIWLAASTAYAGIKVTVTGSTNTTPNLSASYNTFSDALTALNAVTAMTGPVIFTLSADSTEVAPPTGFTIGSATLNPLLSSTNTLTVVKGGGTVTLLAGVGTATPGSAAPDGILKIVGADYVTIDGLTLADTCTANPRTMEFGIGLFKLSASDGAQNNTIKNCTINMQRINNASGTSPMMDGAVGILVINSTPAAATTVITPTAASGTNSNNKIYTNLIKGGNIGIGFSGYAAATPFTLGDTGNDIGGTSTGQGNTILNYGGASGASNPAAGIRANNQWGINISYNTINNNNGSGVNHPSTLRGIYAQAGTSANATIKYNQITIHGGATTSQVAGIENAIGSTAASNTILIDHNTITGDYLTATTGVFYGIYSNSTPATVNITYNTVNNINYSDAAIAGSGNVYPIYHTGAATNVLVDHNLVDGITRTGSTGGTTTGIYIAGGSTQTATYNIVKNLIINGTGASGTLYGIQTSTGTIVVNYNEVYNLTNNKGSGTGVIYGLYNIASPTNENVNYNTVHNLAHSGTAAGATYGIYFNTTTGTRTMSYNTVYTISSQGTTVAGIVNTTSSPNIFKNKIYDISSSNAGSTTVSGLSVTSLGTAGSANVYNNIIGDLRAPAANISAATAPAIRGINITVTTVSSTLNVLYNTVYMEATSTGANFGTAGLYVTASSTATTANLTLRNNLIDNESQCFGTGVTAAYQRSAVNLNNFNDLSNYNLYYAGLPTDSTLIMFDGTNSYSTLAAYKTAVSPTRETVAISLNPVFINVPESDPNYLHFSPGVPSGVESGGVAVTGYNDDYDGNTRQGSAGYTGTGTAPDIGADEFEGLPAFTCVQPNPGNTLATNDTLCLGETITLSLQNPPAGTGNNYQWRFSSDNVTYTDIPGANLVTCTVTPSAAGYFRCFISCSQDPPLTGSSNPVQIWFKNNITSTTPATRCGIGTVSLEAAGTSGATIAWFSGMSGGLPIGTGSPFTTPELTATSTFYAAAVTGSSGTVTVGAGATTSSTYSDPFYSAYSNIHTQHLVPASELYAAGLLPGEITSIALDVTSAGTLPMIDLSVKIGHTTATSVSSFVSTTFTTVYTNSSLMPTTGVNVLTFSTPFIWDGVSNIVVEFCHGNPSSTATMSRTVKADNTSYVSSIKVHSTTASTSNAICGNTTSNLLSYSVRPQFRFGGQVPCSSPRVPVIATVTPPPALTITGGQTICNNSVFMIEVTSAPGDFNNYVWTPATGLFTDAVCENPYTGGNVSTVYFKSATPGVYTFICTGTETGTPCVNKDTTIVTNLPSVVDLTASPGNHCLNGSSLLTAAPSTGYGTATLQWQDSPDNITFTDISGANSVTYTTPTLTSTKYYRLLVKLGASACTISDTATVLINSPAITNTVPATRCGIGTVTLEATGTGTGGTTNWYAGPTGGSPIGTGSPWTTPVISATTSYYVSETSPGTSIAYVSKIAPEPSSTGTVLTTYGQDFTLTSSTTLNSVQVFSTTGTSITISLYSSGGLSQLFTTGPVAVVAGTSPTIQLGWPISPGTYRLCANGMTGNFIRDNTGVTYPFPLGTIGIMNGFVSSITGTVTTSSSYYFMYNWQVVTGCISPRTQVIATVTPPPNLTVTAEQTVCSNQVAIIQVTIPDLDSFDIYSWSPDTLLYSDLACTNPYTTGNSASTVYAKSVNAVSKTYTCTATKNSTGCVNIKETAITFLPPNPVIVAVPDEICQAGKVTLSVSPATGWGAASFVWQDSRNGVDYADIPGANFATYTSDTLRATTYYKLIIYSGNGTVCSTLTKTVTVFDQKITGTTGATRCGVGTVTLEASADGGTINWYTALTGGVQVGTGSPWVTPVIDVTTNYYVGAEVTGPGTAPVGAGASTLATYPNPWYSLWSNMHAQYMFKATELTGGGLRPGNITSLALDVTSAGTLPMIDLSLKIATTTATSMSAFLTPAWTTVYTNASFMPVLGVNTLVFSSPFYWDGSSTIVIEFCHGNAASSATMSRTVKSDATSYVSSVKAHVSAAASASVACANTTTNFATYSSRPKFIFGGQATCSSPRVQVVATIGDPPALTLNSDKTVCPGEPASLYLTSTLLDFDTYVWTPATNLFLDAAGTIPYVPGTDTAQVFCISATGGTFTYTCTGTNNLTECVNTADIVITVLPEAPEILATPAAVCVSGPATLRLSPATGWGTATFQWQDSQDGITWNNITGATAQNYTCDTIVDTMYYKVIIKSELGLTCSSPEYRLDVNEPLLTSTTPGTRCGPGTVTLNATGVEGTVAWYESAFGGVPIGTGNSFTTPFINATTSFYAGVVSPGSSFDYVGMESSTNGTSGQGITTYGLYFNALSSFTLKSVVVYPNSSANGTPGTVTISVIDGNGVVLHQAIVNVIGYVQSSNPTAETVDLNFNIQPANALRLVMTSKSTSISGLMFQPSSQAPYDYPYTIPGVVSITSGTYGGVVHSELYYYFYHWLVSVECVSPLTEVVATVTESPGITVSATPDTLCEGQASTLDATSANPGYAYTWMPGSLSGATQVITPSATTEYTVSAFDATTGCANIANLTVTVNLVPSAVTITPDAAVIAPGDIQMLTASGGNIPEIVLLNEHFNAPSNSWTTANSSTGGTPSDAAWTLRPDGYTYSTTAYHSNDNSQFFMSNSDDQGSGGTTNSELISPVLNATYFNTLILKFWHYFRYTDTDSQAKVEVSTDGGATWNTTTPLASYSSTQGSAAGFVEATVDMSAYAHQSNLKIRFRYHDTYGWYWCVDNVTITGISSAPFTWSPVSNLYTDAAASVPYTGTPTPVVYARPYITTTYTATANSPYNCTNSKDATITVVGEPRVLNLKLFLEGLYAGAGTMNPAYDEYGPHFGPGIADQVTIDLNNEISYNTVVFSSGLVDLGTDGNVSFMAPAYLTGSYWITVKHRNSIQTVSSNPVSFAVSPVYYDFTTGASQAFMDNQREVGTGEFAIWAGDVNKDGIVDSGDMNPVDNASTSITFGYVPEDINGDGIVDSGDMNFVDNNATGIIIAWTP